MKKPFLFLYFTFYIFNSAFSQNPLVKQWDYRFGGMLEDILTSFIQTTDGGYILGGKSYSGIGGDKSQNCWAGSEDYWIVKIDSLGIKQWDKDFGGTDFDYLFALQQTSDGGYILGGTSGSGISGDKTQANWDTSSVLYYQGDYWIVKIDAFGNKQWDKDYGGYNLDRLLSLQQTIDGGYILGGISYSAINGDKTQANWDTSTALYNQGDYWIIKTDSLGNKQWDKDFGGTEVDKLYSIQQTMDGGYILGGFSQSGISGDKTQANWDTFYPYMPDYWIVKTDSLGNKQWDKDFGGTLVDDFYSLLQTADGGYILGGNSYSGISGDKTQDTWGGFDYWIVKTDSLGNKQWDRDFGGNDGEDEFGTISKTSDGGYLISGSSYSPISGDKTENNLGVEQGWMLKTDSMGIKQWDKTIFTHGHDEQGLAIQTKDGCYAIANYTYADIGGYKTQLNWDIDDYWIVKFCDSTLTTSLTPALSFGEGVAITPNPASDELTITSSQILEKIEIFNLLGERVYHQQLLTSDFLLPTSDFPNGLYIIKAYTEKGIFQQKLIVNH